MLLDGTQRASNPRALEKLYAQTGSTLEMREQIISQLGEIPSRESMDVLGRLFRREMRQELRLAILGTAVGMEDEKLLDAKLQLLSAAVAPSVPGIVRQVALSSLTEIEDSRVAPLIRGLLRDKDPEIRSVAAEALRELAE